MNPLQRISQFTCDRFVALSPRLCLDALRRNHYEFVARELNRPFLFDWGQVNLPARLESFDDLVPLFGLSPLGRGIIRQDFDEAAALFRAVRALPQARGVEIGRFNGGSTLLLAVAVGPGGKVISIDTEPQDDQVLNNVLGRAQLQDRVELIVGDANQVERDGQYDFVFIDGDHSYDGARRDHNKWGRLTRPGGFIIHHDMANNRALATQWTDLARLRADILQEQNAQVELEEEVGSMSIFRRKSGAWTEI